MKTEKFDRLPPYLPIAAAAIIPYINALSNTFVWDDIYLVVKNPYIKGWHNVADLFATGYWESIGKTGGLYRPLTMLSFLVEHSIAGLNPLIYHLDNLLLHTACSLLVFFILKELLDDGYSPVIAAVLFAVHPVHTEAVAWVSGRAELLSTLFFLLAFMVYVRRAQIRAADELSALLFLLGILAKETAAVLPLVIILYVLLIRREYGVKKALRQLVPYAAVLAVYVPVRLVVLGGRAGPVQAEQMFANVKPYFMLLTMAKAGLHYIRLLLFPTGLQAVYLFPPPESAFAPPVILFLALLAGSLFAAYRLKSAVPGVSFLILWFIVCLLPVSNIVPTEIIMSERALYLPSVGICGLAGYALSSSFFAALPGRLRLAFITAIILMFAALAMARNPVWRDDRSFAAERVRVHTGIARQFPDYASNFVHLADAYGRTGRLNLALDAAATAVELEPRNIEARLLLAAIYRETGDLGNALEQLEEASGIPGAPLGQVYTDMANIHFVIGDTDDAERLLALALEKDPDGPLQNLNYGFLLLEKGDRKTALAYFTRAGELNPLLFEAFFQKGVLLGELGDFRSAALALEKAAAIVPSDPEARLYLGAAYKALGRDMDASGELEEALRLRPGYPEAEALLNSTR